MHYLVVKILADKGIVVPQNFTYGDVEIRSYISDTIEEIDFLKQSAEMQQINFAIYEIHSRIATIVESKTVEGAIDLANNRFTEICDLLTLEQNMTSNRHSDIGYIKNLLNNEINPLGFYSQTGKSHNATMFQMYKTLPEYNRINWILKYKNELSKRYLRAAHWYSNAIKDQNIQLRVLFYWFCLETLLKEKYTDVLDSRIKTLLGYPFNPYSKNRDISLLGELANNQIYMTWYNSFTQIIKEMSVFRNEAVHAGSRVMDIEIRKLIEYELILKFAVRQGFDLYFNALQSGKMTSISDLIDNIEKISLGHLNVKEISNFIYRCSTDVIQR